MNQSRNFAEVVPGRYQNAINRTVDILDSEIVIDPQHPHDRSKDRRRWRGNILKQDGRTVEQVQYFDDNGSAWDTRHTSSNPMDLRLLNYPFQSQATA